MTEDTERILVVVPPKNPLLVPSLSTGFDWLLDPLFRSRCQLLHRILVLVFQTLVDVIEV